MCLYRTIFIEHLLRVVLWGKAKQKPPVTPRCLSRRFSLLNSKKHGLSDWLVVRYYRVVKNSISFHFYWPRLLALLCMRKYRDCVEGYWHVFSGTYLKDSIILNLCIHLYKRESLFLSGKHSKCEYI